jgi:hypothetical protein
MRTKQDVVFTKHYDGQRTWIPIDDIPLEFLQHGKEYKIHIREDEGYYSENNSWDPFTELTIYQIRPMTEAEKAEEKEFFRQKGEESKKERYEQYLQLKKEFENEQ